MLLLNIGLLYWGVMISMVGFAIFIYGKKTADAYAMIAGIVLMVYPYFVGSMLWSVIIGIAIFGIYAFIKLVMKL